MSRPEQIAPAELYYNDLEASRYTQNSRIIQVQAEMTMRALELLDLQTKSHLLDIGCGSGLSGAVLTEMGHLWAGIDISLPMLKQAHADACSGDLILGDIGQGLAFRAGSFDAAVSVSALQWLFTTNCSALRPQQRLYSFFGALNACLKRGGKACLQFYPIEQSSMDLLMQQVKRCGFGGGLVIDNPESKRKKKYYLLIQSGMGSLSLTNMQIEAAPIKQKSKKKSEMTRKEYILHKKDLYRKRGMLNVKLDSKYTGRKRKTRF